MKLRNKKTGKIGHSNLKVTTDVDVFIYNSLDLLCDEWEDYKPVEPIIKDKKNRELVRDWSKLYDYEPIRTYKRGRYISLYKDGVKGYSTSVGIDLPCDALQEVEDDRYYTITELCGEEE